MVEDIVRIAISISLTLSVTVTVRTTSTIAMDMRTTNKCMRPLRRIERRGISGTLRITINTLRVSRARRFRMCSVSMKGPGLSLHGIPIRQRPDLYEHRTFRRIEQSKRESK